MDRLKNRFKCKLSNFLLFEVPWERDVSYGTNIKQQYWFCLLKYKSWKMVCLPLILGRG